RSDAGGARVPSSAELDIDADGASECSWDTRPASGRTIGLGDGEHRVVKSVWYLTRRRREMKFVVVYESMFGNTETIAQAIAAGLGEAGEGTAGAVDPP